MILLFMFLVFSEKTQCQLTDTTTVKINTRYNFYSYEKKFEILIHYPASLYNRWMSISLKINNQEVVGWKGIPNRKLWRLPFEKDLAPSVYNVVAEITTSGARYKGLAPLIILNS